MLIIKRAFFIVGIALCIASCSISERTISNSNEPVVVGFYNLENLFDTINSPGVRDGEFTPEGQKMWNSVRYADKLDKMAAIIRHLGDTIGVNGPAILGLCEVENRSVIEDLVAHNSIKELGYEIIHRDSPDRRGIDVALLYQPSVFEVKNVKAHPLYIYDQNDGDRIYTRDQLLVSGLVKGEMLHVVVNHWPSRYGGEERSRPSRKAAAQLSRSIVDSLQSINEHANIILMGDLNDDPHNVSVKEELRAVVKKDLQNDDLYNPFAEKHQEGEGTLCYRGTWNMFDQIVMSQSLLSGSASLKYKNSYVYSIEPLKVQEGKYKDYPFRTYVGNRYDGGYSDHYPVVIVIE
ncbi:endonuclease/exonuclease/phosphatase family protein [Carboxylicivirga marina]|uniref:Endonuclease/exonuclease/phosphatase family protein n=1 Tax=Carboxylicivirga marina TaxID=2800988 RepID=A0ABS1HL44_9BACT|nr:endonuclease/exonuclease/phosphatase family protein [Carboxylicivirga marina]MBK3518326.1 endonuclease/exonuclease/phosphatase family protein [Carboxylicivirga marina]